MNIQSEISRLTTAKSNLKSKISSTFAVTIPDTAKLDSYADYISKNADTVDGVHLVVATTEATTDDKTVIRFIY